MFNAFLAKTLITVHLNDDNCSMIILSKENGKESLSLLTQWAWSRIFFAGYSDIQDNLTFRIFWYSGYSEIQDILILRIFWYSGYSDIQDILIFRIFRIFWYSGYSGGGTGYKIFFSLNTLCLIRSETWCKFMKINGRKLNIPNLVKYFKNNAFLIAPRIDSWGTNKKRDWSQKRATLLDKTKIYNGAGDCVFGLSSSS